MNNQNEIIDVVQEILEQADTAKSEYELLKHVEQRCPAFTEQRDDDAKLSLFQSNFIIMNALYQLQQKLLRDNLYVSISALHIRLEKINSQAGQALISNPGEQKLRDYYLDWDNLTETSTDDVEKLLSSFWKTYVAQDQQVVALQQLDLPLDADWGVIKKQYRLLASQHHPDKGGDEGEFKKVRKAYEILQQCGL